MSEASLIRELEALHEKAAAWALSCCDFDAADAEDVLQSAYLEILEGRARFEGRSSARTFLFGMIRRIALSRRRRNLVRALLLRVRPADAPAPQAAPDPERSLDEERRGARVREALRGLARRQREVLELVFFQELTVEEAASVMEVSVGSARVHYARGKERLAAALEGER
ncbi:MAG TPA: sigma-70 family RNA polymerase sigma factor [bacterium]|nr:sigma-70 family RNA polymerase sigma factor [bacterium]